MSVDGLRCILYACIYILYMRTILYHYIQTGRPLVPISSELKRRRLMHTCLTALIRDYPGEPLPEGKTNLDFTETRDSE